MQAFANMLAQLYEAAENTAPEHFALEAFRLCKQLIYFDGGIIGTACAASRAVNGMQISQATVYGRPAELLPEYLDLAPADPVWRMIANGLSAPAACSCQALYKEQSLFRHFTFARKYELNQVLAFTDSPAIASAGRWILLYRRSASKFDAEDVITLHTLWPHLTRAIRVNLKCSLEKRWFCSTGRSLAMLDSLGMIEVADPLFMQLLQEEWPRHDGIRLPMAAWEALLARGRFRGKCISLNAGVQPEYTVCEAQRITMVDRLGVSEKTVAMLIVDGYDYKSIAAKMGTSPNTVRNQISRIYRKLEVHDKVSLASLVRRETPILQIPAAGRDVIAKPAIPRTAT